MSELDTSFLDGEYWKKQGIEKPQLVDMFKDEYKRLEKDNPGLSADELEIQAQEDLKGTIAAYKKGGASMGKGIPFGVTGLFDYFRMWKIQQINAYKDLVDGKKKFVRIFYKDADGKKVSKDYKSAAEMISDKMIRIAIDKKTGAKTIVPLDRRGGEKRGREYGESSNLAMFVAVWESSLTKKRYTIEATIGGEQGDSIVNPKCQECGNLSYGKVCDATVNVLKDGHKVKQKCGAKREGYEVPNILSASGTLSSFAMKMKTNDKKELIGIEWAKDQTKIMVGQKLEIKMDYERKDGKIVKNAAGGAKKMFSGDLLKWIPSERMITCATVNQVWTKNKTMTSKESTTFWDKYGGHAVFSLCTLFSIGSVYYGNRRASAIDDTTGAENDDGLGLKIPDHVYFNQMAGKFGKKSLVLVVGKMDREQMKDFKTKKYMTAKIKIKSGEKITEKEVPVYAKPYIAVSCIIPIKPQLASDEKVKPKEKLDVVEEDAEFTVKKEEVSEEEAAEAVEKIAKGKETTEEAEEETTEESSDEAEDTEDGTDDQKTAESDEADANAETEPESDEDGDGETEDAEEAESEPETKEPPTAEDTEEAPEEVESLDAVDKVDKKQKKKRDWSKGDKK